MLAELRQSLRGLLRVPRFTIPALLVLALGIGATSAVFSVVDSVLLRPLPYREPDRVMVILETSARRTGDSAMPAADFQDFRDQNSTFASMAAAESWSPTLTGLDDGAEQLKGLRASANLFQMLGVTAALGRGFSSTDAKPGAAPVVVLSHSLWQRRFGGDRSVVGRTIRLNSATATIIGVLPEHFYFPPFWATKAEIYTAPAFGPDRSTDRVIGSLRGFGRLKTGRQH